MRFIAKSWIALSIVLASLPWKLQAQESAGQRFHQSPPVLARYPSLPIRLDTPALAPGRTTLTTQVEVAAFIDRLPPAHVAKLTLGMTPGGRALQALLFTHEGTATPFEAARLGRPIVWLIGQQHGNEPAGGEAMLALAHALAGGELQPLLQKLTIVIIPRANPDGAASDTRENAAGNDINRDHGLLTQPEVKLLHDLVRQLPPAVVVDAHEFTVGRRWVEKLGGLQSVDLMLLSATHPMVQEPVRHLANTVFQPAIERAISAFKLSSFVYHTTARGNDRTISVGGNAPGIARNAFGLMGAVSFLLETRGTDLGLENYQRRVATHYIAARAVLETAAEMAAGLMATNKAVHEAEAQSSDDVIVAHVVARTSIVLPLIDPATGQDKPVVVDMLDTRLLSGVEHRARPAGYLVPPDRAGPIRARLDLMGARTCAFNRTINIAIERYEVIDRTDVDRHAINPEKSLTVRLHPDSATAESGSLFVPLDQPAGSRLALALEPDAPGSLSALELSEGRDSTGLGIARVPREALSPRVAAGLVCTPPPSP